MTPFQQLQKCNTLKELEAFTETHAEEIETWIEIFQMLCYKNADLHNFWPDGERRNFGEAIALIHSEISEALEADRVAGPLKADVHVPSLPNRDVEMADALIRILDTTHGFGITLSAAFVRKMLFNFTRPVKHGKSY